MITEPIRLATFTLGGERYGLDIRAVREITRNVSVTPVRGAPAAVRGLQNLRGQVVTVIDPGVQLGIGPREVGPESRLVVLKTNGELQARGCTGVTTADDLVGLLVDAVSDVAEAGPAEWESRPPNLIGAGAERVSGLVRLADALVRVLEPETLLASGDAAPRASGVSLSEGKSPQAD